MQKNKHNNKIKKIRKDTIEKQRKLGRKEMEKTES